jgi:glucose/arabinose dehydrogenase
VFVVDQRGIVRVLSNGHLRTFIDLRSRVEAGGERGLLSIAFHPKFATNHRFFVYYTARGTGDVTVAEGRANGDRGTFRRVLLRIRHRQAANHNGGQLQFGPDGRLWIGTGDGGGGGDQFGHAQDRHSLLGKMLRLNVDARTPRARIWGIGLRNPWRFSFDRANHTLWIGDVGQNAWEEVDRVTRPAQRPLRNFGWSKFEGRSVFNSRRRLAGGTLVRPLTVLPHPESIAIVGGYVYRGSDVPSLRGYYLYSDNANGWIRGIRTRGSHPALRFKKTAGVPSGVTSFGEDGRGNVYVCTYGGVYRIVR